MSYNDAHYGMSPELVNYGYSYPDGLNLHPMSPLHKKIVDEVNERARRSHEAMSNRHSSWDKIDDTLTAYIAPDAKEMAVKNADGRRPVSVVVPLSYATLETLLTYFVGTFLEYPYFRFTGVGPEDNLGAQLLERVIEHQCRRERVGLALHTQFRDALAYGFGVGTPIWTREMGWKTKVRQKSVFSNMFGWMGTGQQEKYNERTVMYEGHRIENVNVRNYLPDVNRSIHDVKGMEYAGWMTKDSYVGLLGREKDGGEELFNCKYLRHIDGKVKWNPGVYSEADRFGVRQDDNQDGTKRPVDVVNMYVRLIPREWKLGKSEYPELWMFRVAGSQIVIGAQPLGLNHNQIPAVVCAPEFDGYSATPISKMEVVYGLQGVIDFLFNSHVTNIRKSLNGMWIVDPSRINTADMKDPGPGKFVRAKPEAFGNDIRSAIFQFPTTDVTSGHMRDASEVTDIVQRVTGAVDMLQGISPGGERRSAQEARDTRTSALSRLAKMTKVTSLMCMQQYAYLMASQTIQLMDQGQYVRVSGDWEEKLASTYAVQDGRVSVSPFDLAVDYDVEVGDQQQGGEFAEQWANVLAAVGQNPMLAQNLDVVRIFMKWAQLTGVKNVDEFRLKQPSMQVMPDDQVQSQVQAGNLLPMNAMQ